MEHKKYKPLYTKRLVSVLAGTALAAALVLNGTAGVEARKQKFACDRAVVISNYYNSIKPASNPNRIYLNKLKEEYLNTGKGANEFIEFYRHLNQGWELEKRLLESTNKKFANYKLELKAIIAEEEKSNQNNEFNFIGAGAGAAFAIGSGCYFTAKIKKAKKEDELALEEAVNAQEPSSDVE